MRTELTISAAVLVALIGIGCDLTDVNETRPGTSGGVSPNWYPANIYAVRVDGTDLVQLTSDAKSYLPRFSPDGTKILFLTSPVYGVDSTSLNRMNSDGTGREVLVTDASVNSWVNRYFAQSANGSSICYPRRATPGGGMYSQAVDLVVFTYATGARVKLMSSGSYRDPEYSFDGKRIFFVKSDAYGSLTAGIYSIGVDGTGGQRCYLTPNGTAVFSCSPAADKLLVSDDSGLFTVNSSGGEKLTLSRDFPYCSTPKFSSNGYRATFEHYGSIYVVNANGGLPVILTSGNQPSLSPDGQTVVFLKTSNTLSTVKYDGSDEKVLVNSGTGIHDPGFSPDGTRILFWQDM